MLSEGQRAGKFGVFDFSMALLGPDITFWAGLIGGAFFTMASHGADQIMVQRYLCSRSLGEARTALVLSGFTVFLQFWLFLAIGVGLFVLAQTGQMTPPAGTRKDEVFGYFIVHNLPVGLVQHIAEPQKCDELPFQPSQRRTRGAVKPLRWSTRSMVRGLGSGRMSRALSSAKMAGAPMRR